MIVTAHEFPPHKDARCVHCGAKPAQMEQRTCAPRHLPPPPRAIPASIFAGVITGIGDLGRQIADEEWAAVRSTPT
jgi:hypothetical protein